MEKQKSTPGRDYKIRLSKEFDLISTLFHEAAHTICCLKFYIKVDAVFVKFEQTDENKQAGGGTYYKHIVDTDFTKDDFYYGCMYEEIKINYAGLAAEKLLYKKLTGSNSLPQLIKRGSKYDLDYINKIIKTNNLASPGKERTKLKADLFKETTDLLNENWEDLSLLAHLLFKKRRLEYVEIKKILIKKSVNKSYWKKQFKLIELINKSDFFLKEEELKKIFNNIENY